MEKQWLQALNKRREERTTARGWGLICGIAEDLKLYYSQSSSAMLSITAAPRGRGQPCFAARRKSGERRQQEHNCGIPELILPIHHYETFALDSNRSNNGQSIQLRTHPPHAPDHQPQQANMITTAHCDHPPQTNRQRRLRIRPRQHNNLQPRLHHRLEQQHHQRHPQSPHLRILEQHLIHGHHTPEIQIRRQQHHHPAFERSTARWDGRGRGRGEYGR